MSQRSVFPPRPVLRAGFRQGCIIFITLLTLFTLVSPGRAAGPALINRKLSGPLFVDGDVLGYRISPDGRTVVYFADATVNDMYELYSVPIHGGTPVRISDTMTNGGSVLSGHFEISGDSRRVVYMADQDTNELIELYSVPITGGEVTKLSDPAVGAVDSMSISPDGRKVVFIVDTNALGLMKLYSVDITGGDPVELNGTLAENGRVWFYKISPNSSWVVYTAGQDLGTAHELYSVPIGGGETRKLNPPLEAFRTVFDFMITPNSAGVAFTCNCVSSEKRELYSNWMEAGHSPPGPIKLSSSTLAAYEVEWLDVTPDSATVVYIANRETATVSELYKVGIFGANPGKLSGSLPPDTNVDDFELTSNSQGVVYITRYNSPSLPEDTQEVYSNYLTGGTGPYKLNGSLVEGGTVEYFSITNNNSRVLYMADQAEVGVDQLYTVPITGGVIPVVLNGPMVEGGKVLNWRITPNTFGVVYQATQDDVNHIELYFTTTAPGGTPVKINGPLAENGNAGNFEFSPDGQAVVYVADQEIDGQYELYVSWFGYQVFLPLSRR